MNQVAGMSLRNLRPPTNFYSGKQNNKSTKLIGQDLHKFLVNSCVNSGNLTCPEVSDVGVFTSLASIKEFLISGYNGL